jgi:hypothetical protein
MMNSSIETSLSLFRCKSRGNSILRVVAASFIIISTFSLNAQILRDTSSIRLARDCMDDIYNYRFAEAERICSSFESSFPDSPVPPLIRGMLIYWKNYPLLPTSPERVPYEMLLKHSITITEKSTPEPGDEVEYKLADLCARGLLLVFYSDNDMSGDVVQVAKGTYHLVRESFNYTSVYSDFSFFTGLYLYYRERYPELHPVYKPFALLFPAGDQKKGLAELEKASSESIVLKAEAGSFLSWIYSGYEYDYERALYFSKKLTERYPGNASYLSSYIKFLLLNKMYDEAETQIQSAGSAMDNAFFRAQVTVLKGILNEKKYRDMKSAEGLYREGLELLDPFGDFANEYSAYACYGLSRVYAADRTGDQKRKFRKEANRLAEFRHMNFDK